MASHGQFCAVARAHDALGGRWTLLVVRELLCGSKRFNEIQRGIPRISRTTLSERLQILTFLGVVERIDGNRGPEYVLTEAGTELSSLIQTLGVWGQKWLHRHAADEDLDLGPVLVDMQRRVRPEALPDAPLVVRFEIQKHQSQLLLLRKKEVALCSRNPGFPEPLRVHGPLEALVAWWRGDASFAHAQRMGLGLEGPQDLVKAFPDWFDRYLFAHIGSVRDSANK